MTPSPSEDHAPGSPRQLVALSGGVDSAVAAGLLAEAGASLVGVFMRNGVSGAAASRSCCSLSDARDARAAAERLGMPFYALDLEQPFARLMDAFAADYAAGLTPNPCVLCNNDLKFGELLDLADELGCATVVTGHYARQEGGRLLRATDREKDQSYLLHGLSPEQLRRARFPLGGMTKSQVRDHARRLGLAVADKPDSADICFVPGGDYREVVAGRVGHLGRAGAVVNAEGQELARHEGIGAFTVGQRRGLGVALGHPAYVSAIDPHSGDVTVGGAEGLERSTCLVRDVTWHEPPAPGETLAIQLRHHHEAEPVTLQALGDDRAGDGGQVEVTFVAPSRAVTPGQYAVFYRGDLVLGGGRVARAEPAPDAPADAPALGDPQP
jgi:tRNA-specific 2-thiouridylase